MSGKRPAIDVLENFRSAESPEAVYVAIENRACICLAATWPNVNGVFRRRDLVQNDLTNDAWRALWDLVTYDDEEWRQKAGVGRAAFDVGRTMLIGNRLIYPDQRLHKWLRNWITGTVLELFPDHIRQRMLKPQDDTET